MEYITNLNYKTKIGEYSPKFFFQQVDAGTFIIPPDNSVLNLIYLNFSKDEALILPIELQKEIEISQMRASDDGTLIDYINKRLEITKNPFFRYFYQRYQFQQTENYKMFEQLIAEVLNMTEAYISYPLINEYLSPTSLAR